MSNESMANYITDVPSAIAELLVVNKQLKQQLESMTNKCADLNYDKNRLASDLNQSKENERQLKQQLEVFKKLAMFNKEEAEKYHDRFKEAVEVIEELYDIVVGHIEEGDKLDSFTLQPAKQFLANYKSLENNVTEN